MIIKNDVLISTKLIAVSGDMYPIGMPSRETLRDKPKCSMGNRIPRNENKNMSKGVTAVNEQIAIRMK